MAEKISPLVELLARKDAAIAELKEELAAAPDIVYCRECLKRNTPGCPIKAAREADFCSYGERKETK